MNPKQLRIAVLMGGPASEHDISVKSGTQVLKVLQGTSAFGVLLQRSGRWVIDGQPQESLGTALDSLKAKTDVVFSVLHGPFGEDGTAQGVLETAQLPYVGSAVMASALAMDKVRTKRIYQSHGLPTATFAEFHRDSFSEASFREQLADFTFPVVLKPSENGSSVGVSFPKSIEEASKSTQELFQDSSLVMVEQFIKGREFTCGILEELDGTAKALPVTEIVPGEGYEFFDYEAKYKPGATAEITPAVVDDQYREQMQALSLKAHQALGCRDMSRTDFMMDQAEQLYLLETNTLPGFTETSLLPQAAKEAGRGFKELVLHLAQKAYQRR